MKKNVIFCFLLWLLGNATLVAQDSYYWQLTDEDGLPSMTVYRTIQDHNGLIWIGTANGLCSFDGKRVHTYDGSALNDQEILKIQEAPDGKIWGINLSGQLFFCDGEKIEVVEKLGDIMLRKVEDFVFLNNKIYIGEFTEMGKASFLLIYNFTDKSSNKLEKHVKGRIFTLLSVENTVIIFSGLQSNSSIQKLSPNDEIKDVVDFPGSSKNIGYYDNNLYVSFIDSKVYKINIENGVTSLVIDLKEVPRNIIAINGFIYFVLSQGIRVTNFKEEKTIFATKSMTNVFLDKENNFFFIGNEGIYIVPSFKTNITNISPLKIADTKITALYKSKENNIITGNSKGNIQKLNYFSLEKSNLAVKGRVLAITDFQKNIYYATDVGLIRAKDNIVIIRTSVKCIYNSKDNRLFYGASNAFGEVKFSTQSPILSYFRTYAISETPDGTIWIGSDKGIYTYNGKEVKPFLDEKTNVQVPYRVSAMKTDDEGRLWATTFGHGVIVIKNGKIEQVLNTNNGTLTNTFNCIFIENGLAWFGSDKGVLRYDMKIKQQLWLNKYYGFPSDEVLSLCTDNNSLLVGTAKGLVAMPFEAMQPSTIAPNLHLLNLKINEIEKNTDDTNIKLSHEENNILIEYVSYQYRSHGNARYEYRITELDTNWTITDQRSLRFPNMSAGNYHFELRAINECDVRSEKTIQLYFQIARPFWLQWWFILGTIGLVAFSVWAVSYRRFKRLETQKEVENSYKLKIDDLRMQAIQAQMNPHFIFNALNAIQHFLTINDDDNAIKFLSKFARLIRMVFEYSKKKEISLSSELDMLNVYLSLEKLRFKEKIDIHLSLSEALKLEKENIFLPPLLIQPIIENSFKHGLFHKENKGNLHISFELIENKFLKCTIEDDGVGRTQAEKLSEWKKKQHISSGLNSTEERIKFWHEKNNNQVPDFMKIEDLQENNQAKGTRITIIL